LINDLTSSVIESAIKVHKNLGPGLLENSYKECLAYELIKKGMQVEKEKPVPLVFEEVKLECGYRLDLLVNNELIIDRLLNYYYGVSLSLSKTNNLTCNHISTSSM